MHSTELRFMALRLEREHLLSQRRLEEDRLLWELDTRQGKTARSGRGGVLHTAKQIAGAVFRNHWLWPAHREDAKARTPRPIGAERGAPIGSA